MKALIVLLFAAFTAITGLGQPAVYIRSQHVHNTIIQHRIWLPDLTIADGTDEKLEQHLECIQDYPSRQPELMISNWYEARNPESSLFIPTLMEVNEGGVVRSYRNPSIAPVILGWQQFRLGLLRTDNPSTTRLATYGGDLAIDNRAGLVDYLIVLWMTSDVTGLSRQSTVLVHAAEFIHFTPPVSGGAELWTLTSVNFLQTNGGDTH